MEGGVKLKIISDGTRRGTRVVNAETGEELEGVQSVCWSSDFDDGPSAEMTVAGVAADLGVDARPYKSQTFTFIKMDEK